MSDIPFRSGFVVLLGRPNTGKSTLLNALVGSKVAIVSSKPQTTRNRIAGIVNRPDVQLVFLDTPGVHKPQHALGENLVAAARGALPAAEVACLVVDASQKVTADDQRAASVLKTRSAPSMLVVNKIDLITAEALPLRVNDFQRLGSFAEVVTLSGLTGVGVEDFVARLVVRMPAGPQYFPDDMVTDRALEFRVSELIREAGLQLTHQEVPHALAVRIDEFVPRDNGVLFVAATLLVERQSQKGIVIGAGGGMLKAIGQQARAQIESLVVQRVFLDLRVKVREKWRQDDSMLERLGYAE